MSKYSKEYNNHNDCNQKQLTNDSDNSQLMQKQLSKGTNKGRWTIEEHENFLYSIKVFGKNWKKVEEHVGTRTGA